MSFLAVFLFSLLSQAQPLAKRPPQFIVIAFDGSYAEGAWKETLRAAQELDVKFTYFVSGVYFLKNELRQTYLPPGHKPGASDIGFGGTDTEIAARALQVLRAQTYGHEIASHANGHFDGSKWTEENWDQENLQFDSLIRNVFTNNKINSPLQNFWRWPKEIVQGFRAPYLAHSPGLRPSLRKFGFKYDTSQIATWNYWPQKIDGIWNFPLASLSISGSNKRTLSMDYNFYVAHSGAKNQPQDTLRFEKEMLETYLQYFQKNYQGPRAPIHIGHHFSFWNGAAYWNALQKFARETCHLPEVRCVTYAELTSWLEEAEQRKLNDPRGTLAQIRRGEFETLPQRIQFTVSEPKKEISVRSEWLKPNPALAEVLNSEHGINLGHILSAEEVRALGVKTDHGAHH
ncbi:MAG: polysaccharide deacetylase family protein [Bdellovibrionales bacterium]|nr:polysaccharide deacetylase family protein [Bdellovibrionales bacterium]